MFRCRRAMLIRAATPPLPPLMPLPLVAAIIARFFH
jgi:hypothetical protein